MKRMVLAGVLAMAAVLTSSSSARAAGFGGIAFGFGIRVSYWADGGHGQQCLAPGCYAAPMVGNAGAYLGHHPWAHSAPFHTDTFMGYGSYQGHFGGHHVSTGYPSHAGHGGMMVGHSYGYGYGGYGYAY